MQSRESLGQIDALPNGLKRLAAGRLELITDLPIDDELKQWPAVLDQAIQIWSERWRVDSDWADQEPLKAYLIGDRKRFQSLGILNDVPAFEDGYQMRDTIFFVEQPSVYYRRHLFLHEATHWAMYRVFGGAGSPWYMEGMADLFGTHRWSQSTLQLGIIPTEPAEVPHWGRFKRLREMIERGDTPSLQQILHYTNDTPDRMDRYVWSWAACVFFSHHPEYGPILDAVAQPPLDYSMALANAYQKELETKWPAVVADWNAFLSDFDFGYDPAHSMVRVDQTPWEPARASSDPIELTIEASRGWQGTGLRVPKGMRIVFRSEGTADIVHNANGSIWRSEPQGITVRYHNELPLGRLIGTLVPFDPSGATSPWAARSIGRSAEWTAEFDGLLFLKVNEPAGQLMDNQGGYRVQIRPMRD